MSCAVSTELSKYPIIQDEAFSVFTLIGAVGSSADPFTIPAEIDHVLLICAANHMAFQNSAILFPRKIGNIFFVGDNAIIHEILDVDLPKLIDSLYRDFFNAYHRSMQAVILLR